LYTIHLHRLEFFAHHGLHDEEKILGNYFEVSLHVNYPQPEHFHSIDDALDYERLFKIVEQHMLQPTALLETIADNIIITIKQQFPSVLSVSINIIKKNPPIPGCRGAVGVTLEKSF